MTQPYNIPLKRYDTRLASVKREGSPSTHEMASASTSDGAAGGKLVASDQSAPASSAASTSASASAPTSVASTVSRTNLDSLSPQPFAGTATEDGNAWLTYFRRFVGFRQYSDDDTVRIFPLFLRGVATDWYDQLTEAVRANLQELEQAFLARFTPSDFTRWVKVSDMFCRTQRSGESGDEFIVQLQKMAKSVDMTDETLIRYAVLKGLQPKIRSYVLQNNAKTMNEVIDCARIAEQTLINDSSLLAELRQDRHVAELEEELRKLSSTVERMAVGAVQPSPPSREAQRRPRFNNAQFRRANASSNRQRPDVRLRAPPRFGDQSARSTNRASPYKCFRCGKDHVHPSDCPAKFVRCYQCQGIGHFSRMCRRPFTEQPVGLDRPPQVLFPGSAPGPAMYPPPGTAPGPFPGQFSA